MTRYDVDIEYAETKYLSVEADTGNEAIAEAMRQFTSLRSEFPTKITVRYQRNLSPPKPVEQSGD